MKSIAVNPKSELLPKSPTGIRGLDEITLGGLPKGRTTLVAGSAGSGKTLLGMEFLVRGATEFNENGVFIAFEETGEYDLEGNGIKLIDVVPANAGKNSGRHHGIFI